MSPSRRFIEMTRNPSLRPPARVVRTVKEPGSLELVNGKFVEVRHHD